ncbi:MAG: hypothetical protein KF778_05690 [Rhodocyclaceae bacterium]|nr:hypothetical protein [Rhodocyclaceae bacterium]MBX3667876.1 hypothetical protein [Rhodocyclaceae bacterium]
MASDQIIFEFKISAWTPETLPMARLASYLTQLSLLFGHKEAVHFVKVVKGSAMPLIRVDAAANDAVQSRLRLAAGDEAPEDLTRPMRQINELLREDASTATLRQKGGAKLLEFKGARAPLAQEMLLFEQGELDGVVIKLGGRDATVPVHLEDADGRFHLCNASRAVAKDLAAHLFGDPVRAAGRGKWRRTAEGAWELEQFDIQSFHPLDATPLDLAVAALRQVPGSEWNNLENPLQELKTIRGN